MYCIAINIIFFQAFRAGLNQYLNKFKYSNASTGKTIVNVLTMIDNVITNIYVLNGLIS
jgi:hypothetical protein